MILHTICSGPDSSAVDDCLRILAAEDAVLLLGNGVYCGLSGTTTATQLATSGHRIYVLEQDLHAAGAVGRTDAAVSVIGFDAFVELTEAFAQHLNWA